MLHDSKIIVFDLDFHKFRNDSIGYWNTAESLMKKISGDQNLVLITNENLLDASNIILKWNFRSGYLIANSGSVIYDIGAQKPIYECCLSQEWAKIICHVATLNNIIAIAHFKDKKSVVYKLNDWEINNLCNHNTNHNLNELEVINNWNVFAEIIATESVNSIELFFAENKHEIFKEIVQNFISRFDWCKDLQITIKNKSIFITAKNASRIHALSKICKELNLNLKTDVLYMGISYFSQSIAKNVYLSVTNQEVWNNSNLEEKMVVKPTTFLNNQDGRWVTWLEENDYLWAYNSEKDISKIIEQNYQKFNLEDAKTKAIKTIVIDDINSTIKNSKINSLNKIKDVFKNFFISKNIEKQPVDDQENGAFLIWPETSDLIVKNLEKETEKIEN